MRGFRKNAARSAELCRLAGIALAVVLIAGFVSSA